MEMSKEMLLDILKKMLLARSFDTPFDKLVFDGKIPATVHQCIGQEGIIGTVIPLRKDDYIFTGHRSHGVLLAKGLDPKKMMAEIFGKSNGYCKGKAGSMHITSPENGAMGSNGILGYVTVLVNGPAFYCKLKNIDRVSVAYFGDGASNQGFISEGMNLASIWKLPTIFVLENNHYAESTAAEYACSVKDLTLKGKANNIPGYNVDGSDVLEVVKVMEEAVANARNKKGPSMLVIDCYRYKGHQIGAPEGYRTIEEIENYKRTRDPIMKFKNYLIGLGYLNEEEYQDMEKEAQVIVAEAIKFADESPYPDPAETYTDVYV